MTYVTMVSGEIDGNQVKNLHYAYVDLDEKGKIEDLAIVKDGDGVSTTTAWDPGIEEEDDDDEEWDARRMFLKLRRR